MPQAQPSHPVDVIHYEAPIQAEANTREVSHCPIAAGATWADLARHDACSDGQVTLANCRLDRAGGRPLSRECEDLLKQAPPG